MKLSVNRLKTVVLILIVLCIVAAGVLISTTKGNFQVVTYKSKDMEPTIGVNEMIFYH